MDPSKSVRLIWTALPDPAPSAAGRLRVNVAVGFVGGLKEEVDRDILCALADWPRNLRGKRLAIRVSDGSFEHTLPAAPLPDSDDASVTGRSSALWKRVVEGTLPAPSAPCDPAASAAAAAPAREPIPVVVSPASPKDLSRRSVLSYPARTVARQVRRQVLDRALTSQALSAAPDVARVQDLWDVRDGLEVLRPWAAPEQTPQGAALRAFSASLRGALEEGAREGETPERNAAPDTEVTVSVADWQKRWARIRGTGSSGATPDRGSEAEVALRLQARVTLRDVDDQATLAEVRSQRSALAGEPVHAAAALPAGAEAASDLVARPFLALQAFHGAAPDHQDRNRRTAPTGPAKEVRQAAAAPAAAAAEPCPPQPESEESRAHTRRWAERGFFERISIIRNHLPLLDRLGLVIPVDIALPKQPSDDLARAVAAGRVALQVVLDSSDPLRSRSACLSVVCTGNPSGGLSPKAHPALPWIDGGLLAIRQRLAAPVCVEHLDVDAAGLALLAEVQSNGTFPEPQVLTTCGGAFLAANAAARLYLFGKAGAPLPATLEGALADREEFTRALRVARSVTEPAAVFTRQQRLVLRTKLASGGATSVEPRTWTVESAYEAGLALGDALRWRLDLEPDQAPAKYTDPPALRTRGVTLVQEDRDFVVRTLRIRQEALQEEIDTWFNASPRPAKTPEVFAGDVLLGVLCDLWSPEAGQWCPLSEVTEEYDAADWSNGKPALRVGGRGGHNATPTIAIDTRSVLRPGVWERFDSARSRGHVAVEEDQSSPALVSYDGTNLGAPAKFVGWHQTACDEAVQAASADGSPVLACRPRDETLPPLLYRAQGSGPDSGWIRVRAVDLAGRALELPARKLGAEAQRLPFLFQRSEPILAPTPLVADGAAALEEWAARGPRELRVDASRPRDVRWLAPPSCDMPQIERHGLGDVMDARNDYGCLAFALEKSGTFPSQALPRPPGARDPGTVPVYRQAGTGTAAAQPGYPFLPDPLAAVVRVEFVPDFALHGRKPLEAWAPFYVHGERWPSASPVRVSVNALADPASEPTLAARRDRLGELVELGLPPGWAGTLRLSCGTGVGPTADRWCDQHALLRSMELDGQCTGLPPTSADPVVPLMAPRPSGMRARRPARSRQAPSAAARARAGGDAGRRGAARRSPRGDLRQRASRRLPEGATRRAQSADPAPCKPSGSRPAARARDPGGAACAPRPAQPPADGSRARCAAAQAGGRRAARRHPLRSPYNLARRGPRALGGTHRRCWLVGVPEEREDRRGRQRGYRVPRPLP